MSAYRPYSCSRETLHLHVCLTITRPPGGAGGGWHRSPQRWGRRGRQRWQRRRRGHGAQNLDPRGWCAPGAGTGLGQRFPPSIRYYAHPPPATLGVRVVLSAVVQYYMSNFISSQCGVEMHGNGLDGQLITHTPSLQHKPLTNPIIRARDGLRTHQGQHTHGDP